MRITLDYQPAVAQRAGIGRYTRLLAQYLPAFLNPNDALNLFYFDFTRRADPPALSSSPNSARVSASPWRLLPGKIIQQLWKRNLPPFYHSIAPRADLYHFTNFIIPPISKHAKTVATIFDMSFMRHPECAEARNLAYMSSRIRATIDRADAIITISQFSANEIVEFFPNAASKITPIYLGLDQSLSSPPPNTISETRRRLGLSRPYILSVGTLEPRKNFPLLVDAFERLPHDLDVDLVIAGRPGWQCEPILQKFHSSPRANHIHYLEFVADSDLAALYAGASLFALSSLYEGFGFPPLEAMQCGTPVVSSHGGNAASSPKGSLAEILRDAAEIVPSLNADAWADALTRNLTDSSLRSLRQSRGRTLAAQYRWEETARQTAEIYHRLSS